MRLLTPVQPSPGQHQHAMLDRGGVPLGGDASGPTEHSRRSPPWCPNLTHPAQHPDPLSTTHPHVGWRSCR